MSFGLEEVNELIGKSKITFGKHKGFTVEHVWETEPEYIKWLADVDEGVIGAALEIWVELEEV